MRFEAELMEVDFDTTTDGMNVEHRLEQIYSILENITALIFIKKKEYIEEEEKKKRREKEQEQ